MAVYEVQYAVAEREAFESQAKRRVVHPKYKKDGHCFHFAVQSAHHLVVIIFRFSSTYCPVSSLLISWIE